MVSEWENADWSGRTETTKGQPSGYVKTDDQKLFNEMSMCKVGQFMMDCYRLYRSKNKDYGTDEERYANFMEAPKLGVKVSVSLAVRMSDKFSRFYNGVRKGWRMAVSGELCKDTLMDIVNYCCIYWVLWNREEKEAEDE